MKGKQKRMNSEEKTKNGVVKGQPSPSGTHSQRITNKPVLACFFGLKERLQSIILLIKHRNQCHLFPSNDFSLITFDG